MNDIKDILKTARKSKGMTQQEVADAAGINIRHYQCFEGGKRDLNNASFRLACAVYQTLGIAFSEVLEKEPAAMCVETKLSDIPHSLQRLTDKPMRIAICRRKLQFADTADMDAWWSHYASFIDRAPHWFLLGYYTQKQYVDNEDARCLGDLEQLKWDCREGKIDLILVQNLHQFSRNITDSLAFIKELKYLPRPVGVFIEQVHLHSLDANAEMLLSILMAVAEDEHRNKHRNI